MVVKWDKNYVRKNHLGGMLGQEYIYYPSRNCQRLLVFFSSMNKGAFERYSWFWDETEKWEKTAFLFLKDDTFKYFLGDDERPLTQTFIKIIRYYQSLSNLDDSKVFTVGTSMGGYAAIYYASLLQLGGAITANPQITFKAARQHKFSNWERSIRSTGTQWYDLDDFLLQRRIPCIYVEYGEYPADKTAVQALSKAIISEDSTIVLKKLPWKDHTVNCLFKSTILACVSFFEHIESVKEKY